MNRVIDYMTPKEVCKAIGISENSIALITRFINDGRIKGYRRFGKSLAIPVSWVKSECNLRGIEFNGVELEEEDIPVSLDDYIPVNEYAKVNNLPYSTVYNQVDKNQYDNFIKFHTTYGLPK